MLEPRIVLLRGINLGHARRVAMADLRAMLEEMGYQGVHPKRQCSFLQTTRVQQAGPCHLR